MFATALLAAALAAPVPKAKAAELYYPTVEGTKWVMQTKSGNETSETTTTVSKVVEKDGKYTVTLTRELGGAALNTSFEVSAEGVFRRPTSGPAKGELTPLLKLPAKEGDTWTTEMPGFGKDVTTTATFTVGKREVVEVPAGKYTATPVSFDVTLNGRVMKSTSWYAPGVGVVKHVSGIGATEQVQELKEFTPGKAK